MGARAAACLDEVGMGGGSTRLCVSASVSVPISVSVSVSAERHVSAPARVSVCLCMCRCVCVCMPSRQSDVQIDTKTKHVVSSYAVADVELCCVTYMCIFSNALETAGEGLCSSTTKLLSCPSP